MIHSTRPASPVILLAHGSRHAAADAAIEQIARAAEKLSGRVVLAAHLDFSPDTLDTAAQFLADFVFSEAVVVPLLFTRAFHLRYDVPEALATAEETSGLRLHLAEGIGLEADVAQVVADKALASAGLTDGAAVGQSVDQLALYSVGSSVPGANEAVADFAGEVAELMSQRLGHTVQAQAFVATGPTADEGQFHRFIGENTVVQPLFVAPGTLWEKQRCRMPKSGFRGMPLGVALAPLVVSRAQRALNSQIPHTPFIHS